MTTDQQREAVARALWDFDQDGTTPVWRDMAWADMGGSEPDEERVRYEMRADAALAALAPVQPDGVWTCGHCGRAPGAHSLPDNPAYECVYEPVWRSVQPDPLRAGVGPCRYCRHDEHASCKQIGWTDSVCCGCGCGYSIQARLLAETEVPR